MVEPSKILRRLAQAYTKMSLRELGVICDLSHESIRKIIETDSLAHLTIARMEKIDKGLRRNGL